MNAMKKMIALFFVSALIATSVTAAAFSEGGDRPRRNCPPPEAFEACEGKIAGDTSQFIGRRGETVEGICEEQGDTLVLRPNRDDRGERPGEDEEREHES